MAAFTRGRRPTRSPLGPVDALEDRSVPAGLLSLPSAVLVPLFPDGLPVPAALTGAPPAAAPLAAAEVARAEAAAPVTETAAVMIPYTAAVASTFLAGPVGLPADPGPNPAPTDGRSVAVPPAATPPAPVYLPDEGGRVL